MQIAFQIILASLLVTTQLTLLPKKQSNFCHPFRKSSKTSFFFKIEIPCNISYWVGGQIIFFFGRMGGSATHVTCIYG
jgi:hypothetical protein